MRKLFSGNTVSRIVSRLSVNAPLVFTTTSRLPSTFRVVNESFPYKNLMLKSAGIMSGMFTVSKLKPVSASTEFKKNGTLDLQYAKPAVKKSGITQHIYSCTFNRKKRNDANEHAHKIEQVNVRFDFYSRRVSVAIIVPNEHSDEFHKFADNYNDRKSFSTYDFHKTIKQFGDKASYDLNDDYFYMNFSYDSNENDLGLHLRSLINDLDSLDSNSLQEIKKDVLAELSHFVPAITEDMEEVVRQSSSPRPQ